jgi:hypothetical protein
MRGTPVTELFSAARKKTTKNRSILFSVARGKPPQIGPNNFRRLLNFGGLHKNNRQN